MNKHCVASRNGRHTTTVGTKQAREGPLAVPALVSLGLPKASSSNNERLSVRPSSPPFSVYKTKHFCFQNGSQRLAPIPRTVKIDSPYGDARHESNPTSGGAMCDEFSDEQATTAPGTTIITTSKHQHIHHHLLPPPPPPPPPPPHQLSCRGSRSLLLAEACRSWWVVVVGGVGRRAQGRAVPSPRVGGPLGVGLRHASWRRDWL